MWAQTAHKVISAQFMGRESFVTSAPVLILTLRLKHLLITEIPQRHSDNPCLPPFLNMPTAPSLCYVGHKQLYKSLWEFLHHLISITAKPTVPQLKLLNHKLPTPRLKWYSRWLFGFWKHGGAMTSCLNSCGWQFCHSCLVSANVNSWDNHLS